MINQTVLEDMWTWFIANLGAIITATIVVVASIIIYIVLKRYINKLVKKEKLPQTTGKGLIKLLKFVIVLVILFAVLINFVEAAAWLIGIFAVIGGAVIGFASVNTVGNMIAGLLIMTSKPFRIGDWVEFNGEIMEVDDIKSIYCHFIDLDRNHISIPNQNLIMNAIVNLGKDGIIRRNVQVTPDWGEDREKVESALLEAADSVSGILKYPKSHIEFTDFKDYAPEYSLFYFINDIKSLKPIEFELRKKVFDVTRKQGIDLSTPALRKDVTPK